MLTLENVEKSFGDKKVLQGVSFNVPRNTIFGFVGQNGAGKTTTMKIILGLLGADKGTIKVCGETIKYGDTKTNRLIGYLPDVPEYYSYMNAREYLEFCGGITGMDAKETKERATELLALVGLANEKHRIKGFSRGMKQRLGIAQALFNRPQLLICDEPTSALDPVGRKEILDILVAAKEQTTVIFSTHILSDVERICDEIAFLHNGKIVLKGSMEEIKNIRQSDGYTIELATKADTEKLLGQIKNALRINDTQLMLEHVEQSELDYLYMLLAKEHISVVKLERQEPSLEALFMEVVGK